MNRAIKNRKSMEAIWIESSNPGIKHRDYRRENCWACWR